MVETSLKYLVLLVLCLRPLALYNPSKLLAQNQSPELNLQTSHLGRIHKVVFSPDGRIVASAAADHTIKIWDVSRRVLVRTLEGHSGGVRSLAFSQDGSLLVSGGQDQTIVLWDVQGGRPVRTINVDPEFWVTGVAFADDNQSIISASHLGAWTRPKDVGSFDLWDLKTGKRIRSFKLNGFCDFLAATQDGSLAYCNTGEIWDTRSGKVFSDQRGMSHGNQAAFSPNGNLLAIVNSYGLDIWDVKRIERITERHDLAGVKLTCIVFSPDGRLIATGDANGRIGLWDPETGEFHGYVQGHSKEISSIAFSPNGRSLVTAATMDNPDAREYSTIKIWKLDDNQLAAVGDFEGNSNSPLASAASSGAPQADVTGHSVPISVVSFSPDGRLLAAGGEDHIVRIWNLQSGSAHTLEGDTGEIRGLSFSPDGSEIASSADGRGGYGAIRLWDAQTGKLLRTLDALSPYSVAFLPNGRDVVFDRNRGVAVWDTASNSTQGMHEPHGPLQGFEDHYVAFVAVSPSGKMIASPSVVSRNTPQGVFVDRYNITIFDRDTGAELRDLSGHLQKINSGVFSPDGRTVVSGSSDSTVKIWDVNNGRVIRTLSGHSGAVLSVAYSPSGAMIASVNENHSIMLWDANTGRLLNTLGGHTGRSLLYRLDPRRGPSLPGERTEQFGSGLQKMALFC
jgi:WD40 repeat protein